jgi:polysaccharide biosynthesis protein PslE
MHTRKQVFEVYSFVRWAVRRHWRKGRLVFVLGAILAVAGAALMPRSYHSEARFFVRFGRENQVDPTASSGQMISLYESRESEINSLLEILKSRAILDRVVSELGPDLVLYGQAAKPEVGETDAAKEEKLVAGETPAPPGPPSREHQLAVTRLMKDVSASAPRKSNIITVSCKARSPEVAQQIVAKLVEVYQEEHVRVHRSPGSYAFFLDQTEKSLAAWQRAANELRQMKNKLGIVTIEGHRKKLEDQIADIDSKRLTNQSELKTTQAKIAALEKLIETLPATLVTQQVEGASPAADGMRQTLYMLELQEREMSAKMQDNHPKLEAVRQQVLELKQILSGQPAKNIQATAALNPARQTMEGSLLSEKAQADALAAREQSLTATQLQLHNELTELNAKAGTIDELQQRVTMAEANHKEYATRLEQARMNRTLDDEQISSLTLVQPASYVAQPGGPRRSLVLALGLFLAASSAMATMLIAAWLNPLITTVEQLAALIDVPLSGVVPRQALEMAAG